MIQPPRFVISKTEHDLIRCANEAVLHRIESCLHKQNDCRLGLAGGHTPAGLYAELSQQHLPWDRIVLISIDERCVPRSDPQNNAGMISRQWADRVNLPPQNFLFFDTSLEPQRAVDRMENALREIRIRREPIFDLLILGAGSDGHVASLFPGTPVLESPRLAAESTALGNGRRFTLTFNALNNAAEAILLLIGPVKKDLLDRLRSPSPGRDVLPVERIIRCVPTTVLYAP